jgi:hypothetical protein
MKPTALAPLTMFSSWAAILASTHGNSGMRMRSPSARSFLGWPCMGSYSLLICLPFRSGLMIPLARCASLRQRLPPTFARTTLSLRQSGHVCKPGTMRTPALTLSATLQFLNGGTISSKESSRRNNAK